MELLSCGGTCSADTTSTASTRLSASKVATDSVAWRGDTLASNCANASSKDINGARCGLVMMKTRYAAQVCVIKALMAATSASITCTRFAGLRCLQTWPGDRARGPRLPRWWRQNLMGNAVSSTIMGTANSAGVLRWSSATFRPSAVWVSITMPCCSYVVRMVARRLAWVLLPLTKPYLVAACANAGSALRSNWPVLDRPSPTAP